MRPLVIAHRGASGYLPEHTLVAKALAVGMGADYLEQDVVATRDGQLIVFHDLTLEKTTDVRSRFPGRARADGSFHCIDFTLDELRSLGVKPRQSPAGGVLHPGRFPAEAGRFGIVTLEEELLFVRGLERATGRRIGIYPEIKEPAWHRHEGIDLGRQMLALLARHGYTDSDHAVFVQCFDPAELVRLRSELGCRLRLVQLLPSTAQLIPEDFAKIAAYADAIGPSLRLIYSGRSSAGPLLTPLVADARAAGLAVHPYTLRRDQLPQGIGSFDELLHIFLLHLGVEGVFTDFPDLVVEYIRRHFQA